MSQNWDFYFLHVDDKPASIFVDLDLIDDAPLEELPNMAYVRLALQTPRPDGFPSQEEYETLEQIEDHLDDELTNDDNTLSVGRLTSDGSRDFFFYTADDVETWEERVKAAMARFPTYTFECGGRPDPEWDTYQEFLYPDTTDMQRIQNRGVCRNLEQHGDNLELPREIDHWAAFETPEDRARFIVKITEQGFTISELTDPENIDDDSDEEEDEEAYFVQFSRRDAPANIDDVTIALLDLAAEFDGDYDGWGAPIVSEDSSTTGTLQ